MCDRAALVPPILGLYAEVYANRELPRYKEVYKQISGELSEKMFPRTYEYTTETASITRELFGPSIDMIESYLNTAPGAWATLTNPEAPLSPPFPNGTALVSEPYQGTPEVAESGRFKAERSCVR